EQPTGSIERVVAAAAVAEGLVLDTAAALIELRVGVLHEMERVRDLPGLREAVGEGLAVGARQVEHPPADPGPPRRRPGVEPGRRASSGAAGHDIEQLGWASDIDDRGAPLLGAPRAGAGEEGLIQPEGGDLADAVGVIDEWCAV